MAHRPVASHRSTRSIPRLDRRLPLHSAPSAPGRVAWRGARSARRTCACRHVLRRTWRSVTCFLLLPPSSRPGAPLFPLSSPPTAARARDSAASSRSNWAFHSCGLAHLAEISRGTDHRSRGVRVRLGLGAWGARPASSSSLRDADAIDHAIGFGIGHARAGNREAVHA
jgi:hypothetical protein